MPFESEGLISKNMTNQQRYLRPISSKNAVAEIPMHINIQPHKWAHTLKNKMQNIFSFDLK